MVLIMQVLVVWAASQTEAGAAAQQPPATITAGETGLVLYEGPSPLTRKVATLPPGTQATIVAKKLFWAQVQPAGSEIRGFVPLPRTTATAMRPGLKPSLTVSPTLTAMATRGLRSVPAGFGKRWARRKGADPEAARFLAGETIHAGRLERFQRQLASGRDGGSGADRRKPQEDGR